MSHAHAHRRRRGSEAKHNHSALMHPPPPPSPDSKTSKGFWKRLGLFQQRHSPHPSHSYSSSSSSKMYSGGDTLLPTTFKMPSPTPSKHRKTMNSNNYNNHKTVHTSNTTSSAASPSKSSPMLASNFCASMNNQFLMGGVDKRRYRRKRRGLLWRIFWSSVPRRLVVSFCGLYLAVFHLVVPLGYWLLLGDASGVLSHANPSLSYFGTGSGHSDTQILQSLVHTKRWDENHLPSIAQGRNYQTQLDQERTVLRDTGESSFPKVFEQIAPEWFHRFDSDVVYRKPPPKKDDPSRMGADYCTHGFDYDCWKQGKPDCCFDETLECPEIRPLCNVPAAEEQQEQEEKQTTRKKETDASGAQAQILAELGADDAAADAGAADAAAAAVKQETKDGADSHPETNQEPKKEAPAPKTSHKYEEDNHWHLIVQGGIADPADEESQQLPERTLHNMEEVVASYGSACNMGEKTPIGTTLVVQTTMDRLWILNETCTRFATYENKIIGVVFRPHMSVLTETYDEEEVYTMMTDLSDTKDALMKACPHLTLVRYDADPMESLLGRYPVNRLRNVGLDLVQTSHVMVLDVDLVPSRDLTTLLSKVVRDTTKDLKNPHTTNRTAWVVPAFEKKPPTSCSEATDPAKCLSKFLKHDGAFLPRTFDELKDCYTNTKECVVFQSEYNWDGHSTTMSDKWMQQKWYQDDKNTTFRSISCFHTARYEPYVVVEWCPIQDKNKEYEQEELVALQTPLSPYYDERFYGYGKNKIELISHLRRSAVRFEVLPEGFVVHNPHPESATKETWLNQDGSSDLHATMDALYAKFLGELDLKYESVHEDTIKLCDREKLKKQQQQEQEQ